MYMEKEFAKKTLESPDNLPNTDGSDNNENFTNTFDDINKEIKNEPIIYGELILLGYNGSQESSRTSAHGRKHRSKMRLCKREVANGIKKGTISKISEEPAKNSAIQDSSRHVVSYSYNKGHTVLVEYVPDSEKDMFQIGRSSEKQIDFTIVDTWLAVGSNMILSPAGNNVRLLKSSNNNGEMQQRPISSTISRYACRIICDRKNTEKCYVYAAGFDSSKNIFLGEKATKWTKKTDECDGLTTNGVLILHPHGISEANSGKNIKNDDGGNDMYVWREISVDGDIYTLRESRSSAKRGTLVENESNQLLDGTLIDLCGATLLWRSAEGLSKSPSKIELERRLDELNGTKPQCPVNLNTLIIPKRKSNSITQRQPYVYMSCGHVQGKHEWGMTKNPSNGSTTAYKCPLCLVDSKKVIQLVMGMESAFHLDSDTLEYCFNPCGHMASKSTVEYWSRIPLPHGTNSFHPVCPFCTSLLILEKPYIRLIFQDHCYDGYGCDYH
uniref:Protein pellino (inferred by orthology to a D. melanogaster protein) n=1 Tax=Strongyloides venezuelensis TaxID=75913 RepID=A0A0K0FVT8_STRVS